jgi:hypothetical protein
MLTEFRNFIPYIEHLRVNPPCIYSDRTLENDNTFESIDRILSYLSHLMSDPNLLNQVSINDLQSVRTNLINIHTYIFNNVDSTLLRDVMLYRRLLSMKTIIENRLDTIGSYINAQRS